MTRTQPGGFRQANHVVVTDAYWAECLNCGRQLDWIRKEAWTPMDVLIKSMKSFALQHADCPPTAQENDSAP
jgi:hypothetical protein